MRVHTPPLPALFALFVALGLSFNAAPACAERPWWEGNTRKEFLNELLTAIEARPAYQCKMRLESYDDGYKEANQMVWYKQPGHMRIVQLGPFKKGSLVVVESGGKITARLGGLFSFLPVSVRPDSALIRGITGEYAPSSSYQAVINIALSREPMVTEFSISPAAGAKEVALVYKVNEPINTYKLTVDAERKLITGLDRLRREKLSSRVTWSDVRFGNDMEEPYQ